MKLKEFNPGICKGVHEVNEFPATISMCTKRGIFIISRAAGALIGLADKDQVVILQDEDNPEDWYLEVVSDKGFVVRCCKTWSNYKFNSTIISRKISESVGFKGRTGKMLIAGIPTRVDGRTLWGILTISLKSKK